MKYDAEKDAMQMTNLSAFFSGGMNVAKDIMKKQLSEHRKNYLALLFCGVVLFGAAMSVIIFRRNRIER